jgi:hypothetical protein
MTVAPAMARADAIPIEIGWRYYPNKYFWEEEIDQNQQNIPPGGR